MSSRTKTVENSVKTKALESIWKRAFKSNSPWPDKEEFLDVIYWLKQGLGILLGILWGILPLKGFLGILLFLAVNAVVIYFYMFSFQSIDEEEYGGVWELAKEGFMTSFSGFLVMWILMYTGFHGSHEL